MTHPPFKLEGLDHVVLLVRGMAEAQHFYEQVLGCSVDRALPNMECSNSEPERR